MVAEIPDRHMYKRVLPGYSFTSEKIFVPMKEKGWVQYHL